MEKVDISKISQMSPSELDALQFMLQRDIQKKTAEVKSKLEELFGE